jgi:hypothetical protein
VYTYNNNGKIKYATCVFKKEKKGDTFNKMKTLKCAKSRYLSNPVNLEIESQIDDKKNCKDVIKKIDEYSESKFTN